MTNEDLAKLEPAAAQNEIVQARDPLINDLTTVAFSIAISLKRIADDVEQIKHGYRFMCENWSARQ